MEKVVVVAVVEKVEMLRGRRKLQGRDLELIPPPDVPVWYFPPSPLASLSL